MPLRLRPLEVGDLLDETFRMYRRHFLLFAGISIALSIPAAALAGYYYSIFGDLLQQMGNGRNPDLTAFTDAIGPLLLGLLLNLVLVPFTYGAVTYAACESALGHQVTAGGVMRGVLHRYFQLGGYVFLIAIMAVMFCVLPLWIWIWVGWAVVAPVMFIEQTGLTASMGRSWRMVEGRWWRTFLILFLVFILVYVVRLALGAFLLLGQGVLDLVLSPTVTLWISASATTVIDSLVSPILQIAIVLVYFDLRVRREGLDLFQLAQRVTAPQPTS